MSIDDLSRASHLAADRAAREALLGALCALARRAARAVMNEYEAAQEAQIKADGSPLTRADLAADAVIKAGLAALAPDVPVVSEEDETSPRGAAPARFFLVDPLDGTREFLSRNGEFTVNIALIEDGRPTLGVVCAPALDRLFCGGEGLGAFLEDGGAARCAIAVRRAPMALTAVASRSHAGAETEAWLSRLPVANCVSVGSSLKLCLVAAGEADVYPRFGRTMEWDIAAGDAVLRAAGGLVTCRDGATLAYGKCGQAEDADFANPHFVAWGDADCRQRFEAKD